MAKGFRVLALAAVLAAPLSAGLCVASKAYGDDDKSRVTTEMLAMQFDYYDELDLKRYASLEREFGVSNRVFESVKPVRFGQLDVRAKLIIPRSDAPVKRRFHLGSEPEPVRVMLDYALVSCRNGCEVGVLTEPGATASQFKASHDSTDTFTRSPYAARNTTRSMVLIEGKRARLAIRQLNGSQRAHIALVTAVHGAANFEFDTSSGGETR